MKHTIRPQTLVNTQAVLFPDAPRVFGPELAERNYRTYPLRVRIYCSRIYCNYRRIYP